MGRTIPTALEQCPTRQLGRSPTNSPVRAQFLAQRNHETLTIQVAHGKRTKDDMGGKNNKVAIGRPTTTTDEGSQGQGTGVHQTRTKIDGGKGQDQVYALPERSPSLARRG